MDIVERLPLESVRTASLIVCEHRHRYELAASVLEGLRVLDLACGVGYGTDVLARTAAHVVGVDNAAATIDSARVEFGGEHIEFVAADAIAYLRGLEPTSYDAIVCFEGLEHLADVEGAFRELRRLGQAGVKMVLSVPNSATLGESNEFHVTDFDRTRAEHEFGQLGELRMLGQFLAEGSLVLETPTGRAEGAMAFDEDADLDYANHFLAFVNVTPPERTLVRMQVAASPLDHFYIRSLERANAELERANARLARGLLGPSDSAAASTLARLEDELRAEVAAEVERLRAAAQEAAEGRAYAETLARDAMQRHEALERELARLGRFRRGRAAVKRMLGRR